MPDSQETQNKDFTSENTGTLLSQPGGLFTTPGLENAVISLHVRARGIGSLLPAYPSVNDDPRYPFLVGISDVHGNEPERICEDAPSGYMKAAELTAQFGRVARQTNEIVPSQVIMRQRGAQNTLRLIGQLTGDNPFSPKISQAQVLDLYVKAEMMQVGVQMNRVLTRMAWQGNPANNTAGGGYKEFPGLDLQIATGHVDAETGVAVPSADSYIADFGGNAIDSTSRDIVAELSEMEYHLNTRADQTGVDEVQWVLVMRRQMWHALTAVWPCRYLTDRCGTIQGSEVMVINDDTNVRMRDDLRRRMRLPINGREYPVVLDDGLYEHDSTNSDLDAGDYAAQIAMVPLTIANGFPVTYWEHVDYSQITRELAPIGAMRGRLPFWTDGARFMWTTAFQRECFNLQAYTQPRIVLRTPHLAGKLQNVVYSPMRHIREPFPDNPYWVDGGVSTRDFNTGQAVWK